jgi:hypothetical protein
MIKKICNLILLGTLITSNVFADGVTISSVFANGTASFVALLNLLQYVAYAMGLYFVVVSVTKLPKLADAQAKMSPKEPIINFLVGICLITITKTMLIVSNTMALTSGPGDSLFGAISSGGSTTYAAGISGVLTFIRLVGFIAFLRGWLLINSLSVQGGGRQGEFGRGLTHIFGGIACMYIKVTAIILANTFAPTMNISKFIS